MSAPAVLMYATGWCPYCQRARALLDAKGVAYAVIDVEAVPGARDEMRARSGRTSVPQIFIGERHIGGFDDTKALDDQGGLDPLLAGTAGH
ncbi:MAG: glutaredoxin 3 [Pseudomonadota bacterium]|jgi:glutaredoxin 3